MIKYLTYISLFVILCSCTHRLSPGTDCNNRVVPEIADRPMHFRATITFGKNNVTGLMAVKQRPDRAICGSFTNEFGVKGFDFIYKDGKTNLVYVMPALDRYMIKKILRRDISLMSEYGIGNIGKLNSDGSGKEPEKFYPDPAKKCHKAKNIVISGSTSDRKKILVLEDLRYKLRIDLISLLPDEE
jgi:hypothetical protein